MKLAIVGSRTITGIDLSKIVDDHFDFLDRINEVVSGGAIGIDTIAEKYASDNNFKLTVFKPDWDKFGKAAGAIRNKQIADYADQCLAIWDGKSKGTMITVDMFKKQNKRVIVIIKKV